MRDVIEDVDAWVARGDKVALATVDRREALGAAAARREDGGERPRRGVRRRVAAAASRARSSRWPRTCWRGGGRGSSTSASPTPRRGTSGCRAAARSRCSWSATSREPAVASSRHAERRGAGHRARRPRAVGAKLLVTPGRPYEGTLGDPELDARQRALGEELMWAERSERREVEGGVAAVRGRDRAATAARDVRRGRLRRARCAGWRARPAGGPYVIDPRGRFATRERFPDAEEIVVAWPERGVRADRRDRPRHLHRGADPRPEARRRRARAGAALRRRRTSARWARGGRRRSGASGCVERGHDRRGARPDRRADRPRPGRPDARRRRRCRSWPRWWRCVTAARAGGCPTPRAHPRGGHLIGGLVLAAGESKRFGGRKQLADARRPAAARARAGRRWRRRRSTAWSWCWARTPTRSRRRAAPRRRGGACASDWAEGMGASLRAGVAVLGGCDAVWSCARRPAAPLRRGGRARGVPARRRRAGVRATYGGVPGHPVLLERTLLDGVPGRGATRARGSCCTACRCARWPATASARRPMWTRPRRSSGSHCLNARTGRTAAILC